MTSRIYYHVYVSSSVNLMSSEELVKLLTVSRNNNSRLGITGMLLHKDGNFIQAIEGPEDEVKKLLNKISQDTRHRGIITLIEGYSETRQFNDWSMGFRELNSAEAKLVPGYSEFLNTPLTEAEFANNLSRCQLLLTTFKNNMVGS